MTTTVTIEAHCSPEKHVIVHIGDNLHYYNDIDIETIEDGFTKSFTVYENREIRVCERKK